MLIDVIMPQLGESVSEGTITKWLVREGDIVKKDQPLVEIATDKADSELPAPHGGRVGEAPRAGRGGRRGEGRPLPDRRQRRHARADAPSVRSRARRPRATRRRPRRPCPRSAGRGVAERDGERAREPDRRAARRSRTT